MLSSNYVMADSHSRYSHTGSQTYVYGTKRTNLDSVQPHSHASLASVRLMLSRHMAPLEIRLEHSNKARRPRPNKTRPQTWQQPAVDSSPIHLPSTTYHLASTILNLSPQRFDWPGPQLPTIYHERVILMNLTKRLNEHACRERRLFAFAFTLLCLFSCFFLSPFWGGGPLSTSPTRSATRAGIRRGAF